jgi:hypothetical protein
MTKSPKNQKQPRPVRAESKQAVLKRALAAATAAFTNAITNPSTRPTRSAPLNPNDAIYSDRGRINPNLGNRGNAASIKSFPPTSGMTGLDRNQDPDYFRQPALPTGQYPSDPHPSITTGRVTLSVRMRFNPIKNLTFERMVGYLEQWDLGYFRMAALTWHTMAKRDYQLKTDIPKRKKAIARNGYDILTLPNVPKSDTDLAERQKEFLQNFYYKLQVTSALNPDEEGGCALLFRQMMDAVGMYYAIHEIVWQPGADGSLTAKLINIPVWWVEGTRGKLRFLLSEFSIYGVDMDPGEWLITCGDGLMEACSIIYLFKNLPLKSWLSMLDRLGSGGLIGKTNAAYNSPEWQEFADALKEFAEDWSGIFSTSADISLLEAKNVIGEGPFNALIDKMDRAITAMWRGSALASKTSGAQEAGASIQLEESQIFEADDAQVLSDTLKMKLSRYALAWKFGPDAPQYAYIQVKTTPRDDRAKEIAVDEFLAPFGVLEKKTTLERYSRPLPDAGAEILQSQGGSGNLPDEAGNLPGSPGYKPPGGSPAGTGGWPEPPQPDKGQFTNAAAPALSEVFEQRSAHALAAAVSDDMQHVAARLAAIMAIQDPDAFKAKMQKFLDDYPGLLADVLADPESARVLANISSAALASGLSTPSAQMTNENPNHDELGRFSAEQAAIGKVKDVMSGKLDGAANGT